jgi:transglutaminase-like putative cysteine protease
MPNETNPTTTTYDIRHVTVYDYKFTTPFARCILRLMPIDRLGQRVVDAKLTFDPTPDKREEGMDSLGNHMTRIAFHLPHRQLRIGSTARVQVSCVALQEAEIKGSPAWETLADQVLAERRLDGKAPVNFLFASRYVPLLNPVMGFAVASLPPGRPIVAAALDLALRIRREFTYDPTATTISTPLTEVFERKRGVCQDFAHLMISGLRSLGVPAAYVSGYLRTVPPPGQPRLEGADAMHAWVAVWCGRVLGWVGVDPTNGIMANNSHIVVAIGRDYSDVSPIDGFVVTSGEQTMRVAVDVIEIPHAETAVAKDDGADLTTESVNLAQHQ